MYQTRHYSTASIGFNRFFTPPKPKHQNTVHHRQPHRPHHRPAAANAPAPGPDPTTVHTPAHTKNHTRARSGAHATAQPPTHDRPIGERTRAHATTRASDPPAPKPAAQNLFTFELEPCTPKTQRVHVLS